LKNTQTWESMLSQAGQQASNEEELGQLKSDAWKELISSKKIGYFALLRNIRNIINQAPDSINEACQLLTEENKIKSSRVLPFRFKTAYDEISNLPSSSTTRNVLVALDSALGISVSNVPKFEGETLVVVDVSGSMSGKPSEIASLFAAILAKSNNCDVMTFANHAQYVNYNPNDSVISIKNSFRFTRGGTNFKDIFLKANKKYDRVIILSDMQSFIGYDTPLAQLNSYKTKFNCNPYVYSWDLAGLGTMQFPENNVFALAGFSDKVFQIMEWLEIDRNQLYKMIDDIQI